MAVRSASSCADSSRLQQTLRFQHEILQCLSIYYIPCGGVCFFYSAEQPYRN